MAFRVFALLAPFAHFQSCAGHSVTPVEKVITLMEDLKTQVEAEGAAEATTYSDFACFCRTMTDTKSTSITTGQDNIDLASATIAEKTAEKDETTTELTTRKANDVQLKAELEETTVRCAKDQAEYEAKDADLVKAITSLQDAHTALSDAKPASFLAVRKTIGSFSLERQARLLRQPGQVPVIRLLQQLSHVDPADPTYQYHSQGILDTIAELLAEFQEEKSVADAEWAKTNTACNEAKTSYNNEIAANAAAIAECESDIESLKVEIATNRENLVNSEAMLKDDQLYLKDLTARCEARAKDWDQRSQMRADELTALSQALTVLENRIAGRDSVVNQRALLLQHARINHHSPVVVVTDATANRFVSSLLQVNSSDSGHAVSATEAKVAHVMTLLRDEGARLHSVALSSIAARAAADPFAKVKTLIQQLVERLLKEATAEATKKGFCDTELSKAEQDRDNRWADVQKLDTELAKLEAKKDFLEEEISTLSQAIVSLTADLGNATEFRAVEKAENLNTTAEAREGLEAITEAIGILKAFYKQAAKATVLTQASPVDEDTSGPGFTGAYKGSQDASAGILGLLEVIKSDFERTVKTTEASEKKAAADFVEFDRVSKTDISGKETKKALDEEDLETTNNKLAQATADITTNQELLDSALRVIEELQPTCIDMTMPYAERVQKREEEIAALRTALCILDTEGVESECQTAS